MRYTSFTIENFKGIRKVTIDLAPASQGRIYTFVGLNESGKTTILEALALFSQGTEDLNPRDVAGYVLPDEHAFIPVHQRANFHGATKISAVLELAEDDIEAVRETLKAEHDYVVKSINPLVTITDSYNFSNSTFDAKRLARNIEIHGRYKNQKKDWPLKWSNTKSLETWKAAMAVLRPRIPRIWYFPNFLFDFPEKIYLTPRSSDTDIDKFYRVLVQDMLDSLSLNVSVENHLVARATSGSPSDRNSLEDLLLKLGRRVTDDVFSSWGRIFNTAPSKRVVTTLRFDEANDPYLEFKIEDTDGMYSIADRSLGFRWFFVFLLLTTYRGFRRSSSSEMLFLFDEPASNLHPKAQAQLLKSFETLADRCQIIYATHSHHLINPDWLEQTYIVRNRAVQIVDDFANALQTPVGNTDIAIERYRSFVSQHPQQTQYFQPILDVLDYAPSRLEMVPSIVLVEGKNDYYLLRYAQLCLGIELDFGLYPGDGAGTLDVPIGLYLAWARPLLVLLDADSEGTNQESRYRAKFGEIVAARVMTLEALCPELGGQSLDKALEPEDIAALCKPIDGQDVTKKVLMRAVQEALAARRPIVLSNAASNRLTAVLNGLIARMLGEGSATPGRVAEEAEQ